GSTPQNLTGLRSAQSFANFTPVWSGPRPRKYEHVASHYSTGSVPSYCLSGGPILISDSVEKDEFHYKGIPQWANVAGLHRQILELLAARIPSGESVLECGAGPGA